MRKLIVFLVIGFFVFYFFFEARNFLLGPKIIIETPLAGQVFENSEVRIEGRIRNVSFLALDGRQIFLDQEGRFKEHLLLPPGYNMIELAARDNFGRQIKETRAIMVKD